MIKMEVIGGDSLRNVFDLHPIAIENRWIRLPIIDNRLVEQWKRAFSQRGLDPDVQKLELVTSDELERRLTAHRSMSSIVEEELRILQAFLPKPLLFILTDAEGIVLDMYGPEDVISRLRNHQFQAGSLMSMSYAGINAISVAMEMEHTAVIQGNEHQLRLFETWSCICSPIRINGQIHGFLDLSLSKNDDVCYVVPLLQQLILKIEERCLEEHPEFRKLKVYELFDQYAMSNREKEVGFLWLSNQSIEQIANKLNIAQGTVKNVLKNVYRKTGVREKGEFIIKFFR